MQRLCGDQAAVLRRIQYVAYHVYRLHGSALPECLGELGCVKRDAFFLWENLRLALYDRYRPRDVIQIHLLPEQPALPELRDGTRPAQINCHLAAQRLPAHLHKPLTTRGILLCRVHDSSDIDTPIAAIIKYAREARCAKQDLTDDISRSATECGGIPLILREIRI